jgi:hypothetical protein
MDAYPHGEHAGLSTSLPRHRRRLTGGLGIPALPEPAARCVSAVPEPAAPSAATVSPDPGAGRGSAVPLERAQPGRPRRGSPR